MATVGEIIENVYDMVLGGRRAVGVLQLRAAIGTTDTTVLFASDVANVSVNDIIEIEDEQLLVLLVLQASRSVNVIRGFGRTAAVAHASGTIGYVQPVLKQKQVREAITRELRSLPPKLFTTESYDLTSSSSLGWYELLGIDDSARVVCIASVMLGPGNDTAGIWTNGRFTFQRNLTDAGTGRAGIRMENAGTGREIRVTVGVRFDTTNMDDTVDITDLGFDTSWQDILELGASAQCASALEAQRMLTDRATVGPDTEKVQSGSRAAVASMFTRQRNKRLAEAHVVLRSRYPYLVEGGG